MIRFRILSAVFLAGALLAMMASCKKDASRTTGWEYNNPEMGGFEVASAREQMTGPGLVLIEGGSFTMGANNENLTYEWDNIPAALPSPPSIWTRQK